jgi:hypothetical protein
LPSQSAGQISGGHTLHSAPVHWQLRACGMKSSSIVQRLSQETSEGMPRHVSMWPDVGAQRSGAPISVPAPRSVISGVATATFSA